ncbi:MAG: hypothetical protein Q9171_002918 [Xanthocarpia ochracea]
MNSEWDPKAIVYLRPQTDQAIADLELEDNKAFVKSVAPPPEPADIPLDGLPVTPPTYLSPLCPEDVRRANVSRESTPGPYTLYPQVCRLGFDTVISPTTLGFVFGSRPDANIKTSYHGRVSESKGNYFRIHYNFESGALLITAMEAIRVGAVGLEKSRSLLLTAGMSIHCGYKAQVSEFTVEFPDLASCADQHEVNYQQYVERLGLPTAPYLITLRSEDPPIGCLHRSKALLGKGAFGEVHKAVHVRNGNTCAIKILTQRDGNPSAEDRLNEVKILSQLSHPNIIQYYGAFEFNGQVCLKMELAANDLLSYRDARKNSQHAPFLSLQCIRFVGRQALLALQYLHGQGVTHRDLKPENILVTKWDPKTDLPTIKLADFGMASPNDAHDTICGTPSWMAPEVQAALNIAQITTQSTTQSMTQSMTQIRIPLFNNSVDIWALGKVLDFFVREVPSHRVIRHRLMPVKKGPPTHLIDHMMRSDPTDRPTAERCLQYPWMLSEDCYNAPVEKRDRSPTESPETTHPIKKLQETHPKSRAATDGDSKEILLSALWPRVDDYTISYDKQSHEMNVQYNSMATPERLHDIRDPMHVDCIKIKPAGEGRFVLEAQSDDRTQISGSLDFRESSSARSIQLQVSHHTPPSTKVAEALKAMAQHHEHNKEEAVRVGVDQLYITTPPIQYNTGNPMVQLKWHAQSLPIMSVNDDGGQYGDPVKTTSVQNARILVLEILKRYHPMAQLLVKASTIAITPLGKNSLFHLMQEKGTTRTQVLHRGLCQHSLAGDVAKWFQISRGRDLLSDMMTLSNNEVAKTVEDFLDHEKQPQSRLPHNELQELLFLIKSSELISALAQRHEVWAQNRQNLFIDQLSAGDSCHSYNLDIDLDSTNELLQAEQSRAPRAPFTCSSAALHYHDQSISIEIPQQFPTKSQRNKTDTLIQDGLIAPNLGLLCPQDLADQCMPESSKPGSTWSEPVDEVVHGKRLQASTTNAQSLHSCDLQVPPVLSGNQLNKNGGSQIADEQLVHTATNYTNEISRSSAGFRLPSENDATAATNKPSEWNQWNKLVYPFSAHEISTVNTWPRDDQSMGYSNYRPEYDVAAFTTWPQNQAMDHPDHLQANDMTTFAPFPQNAQQRMNYSNHIPEHDVATFATFPQTAQQRTNHIPEHDVAVFTTWPRSQTMDHPDYIPEHDIAAPTTWPNKTPLHEQMNGDPGNIILCSQQQQALLRGSRGKGYTNQA